MLLEKAVIRFLRLTVLAILAAFGPACFQPIPSKAAPALGLTLGPDATVLKDGKPFRAVGVNYYDCFIRVLANENDTSYEAGFQVLQKYRIPFARFSASGYFPNDMKLYRTNPEAYFRRLDAVVRSAQTHHVGLIPSLFWAYATVPDIVKEPVNQWGNPLSKTHAFMRQYVREVVTRYKSSPAIWAWEFGNELNLVGDLPNAATHRAHVLPARGTPTERSAADDLTCEMLVVAWTEFAREVPKHDPHRLITTGNAILRPHAWHNCHEHSWNDDTQEQFEEMLARTTPDPMSLISAHLYQKDLDRLDNLVQAAGKVRKPVFIGEFQVPDPDALDARARFAGFLDALARHNVPLAAMWVYDYPTQEQKFSVSGSNARSWQLSLLRDWNQAHASPRSPDDQ